MSRKHRNVVVSSLILAAFALSASAAPAQERAIEREGSAMERRNTITGTWRVAITLRVCASGAAIRDPFPAMATFAQGGAVTTADGSMNPALRSTGHGTWRHESGRGYRAVIEAFLFNAGGTLTGRQRFIQSIELSEDGRTFEATVAATILDPAGNVVGNGCATSTGHRLE